MKNGEIKELKSGVIQEGYFKENDQVSPFADDIGCYSIPNTTTAKASEITPFCEKFGSPAELTTSKVVIAEGYAVEFMIVDGRFTLVKRPDMHYDEQGIGVTQTWLNATLGKFTQLGTQFAGTFLSYKVAGKVPYMSKLMDKYRNHQYFPYANNAMKVGLWQIQNQVPVYGDVIATPVPKAGTQEVVVYLSKTGKANTWHHRARFVIEPSGKISYNTWIVA